jgi:two-component system phosphate regulon response regulator PhoB
MLPDLVVLDWMLPGQSGLALARRWRADSRTRGLPIIMLTARGEESERIRGLATGADDYIVKPFSVPELLARVKGLLRRASPERLATVLTYGDIELDREKRRVARSGCRSISARPSIGSGIFLEHPGRVFSREQLLDSVWGRDIYIDERTVDVHIGRLRKLLNPGREQDPIRTVRGAGYALEIGREGGAVGSTVVLAPSSPCERRAHNHRSQLLIAGAQRRITTSTVVMVLVRSHRDDSVDIRLTCRLRLPPRRSRRLIRHAQ